MLVGEPRSCSVEEVEESLDVSLVQANDAIPVTWGRVPESPVVQQALAGDVSPPGTGEWQPHGPGTPEELGLRSPGDIALSRHTEADSESCSTPDRDLGPEGVSSVPVKKWYEIEFSPTTFRKRSFTTEAFDVPPCRSEYRVAELVPDVREGVSWDFRREVEVETREQSYFYVTGEEDTEGPPYIQETVEDLQVQMGAAATFSTLITGRPAPAVSWYKDGELLSASERIVLEQQGARFCLTVVQAETRDGGIYTCTARNAWGEASCKAELAMEKGAEDDDQGRERALGRSGRLHSLYEVHEEIGRGCFSYVKRVTHKGSGEAAAAKFIPLRRGTKTQAFQERALLSQLSHHRVVCLLGAFYTRRTLVLVTDLCSSQGLLEHLLSQGSVPESEVRMYIKQILEGLDYIHGRNILHLDIKPANILMALPERDGVKICDFGFAQEIDVAKPQYSRFGTPEFVAPEVVCQGLVSKATDIWSLGVLSFLCLTGGCPFSGENDRATLLSVQGGRVAWDAPDVTCRSGESRDFLQSIIQLSAEKRPTASECLGHNWFQLVLPDAELINTKKLKFFVSRSKWQRSLMCYGSVLAMRSIAELLAGVPKDTSLTITRDQQEHSSSSPSSASSSDYEDVSQQGETLSLGGPEALAATRQLGPVWDWQEKGTQESGEGVRVDARAELSTSSASAGVLGKGPEKERSEWVPPRLAAAELGSISSEFRLTVCKAEVADTPDSWVKSTETPGRLSREGSADSSVSLCVSEDESTGSSSGRIPRESVIKSTFYSSSSELSPLSARRLLLQGKKFMKRHERTRKHLLTSGLSSRLREPLLEHAEDNQNETDDSRNQGSDQLVMAKSSSFDSGVRVSSYDVAKKRRSRSLDEYKTRTPTPSDLIEAGEDIEGPEDFSSKDVLEVEMQIKPVDILPEGVAGTTQEETVDEEAELAEVASLEVLTRGEERAQRSEVTPEKTAEEETSDESKMEAAILECILSEMVCLSEEINVITASKSAPERLDIAGASPTAETAIPEECSPTVSDSQLFVDEPLELKPIFVESTTPMSAVQEVSELLTSQYGLSQFERPQSFHLSFKALERLELENKTHFPKLHITRSESGIRKYSDPALPPLGAEPVESRSHSATCEPFTSAEPCGFELASQYSLTELEALAGPEESYYHKAESPQELFLGHRPEEEYDRLDVHMPEDASAQASPYVYLEASEAELEPELLDLLEEVHMYENLQLAQAEWSESDIRIPGEDTPFPVKSASSVEVSRGEPHESFRERVHRPASAPESKRQPNKSGKYGLLRFFRKHASTDQPSTSAVKAPQKETPEEKWGDSAAQHQQHQRAPDSSLTKKVKASVSSISKAVWGRQASEKEKKEGETAAGDQSSPESPTESSCVTAGSLKKKSGLFSFKLPSFKRSKEPVFLEELPDQAVSLGQSVLLSCRLAGHPPPDVRWYKEGRQIQSNGRICMSVKDRESHSLVISSAREEDLGSYRCVASNALGQASSSCTLIVSDLPTCPASPEPTQVDGNGVLLTWKPVESIQPLTYSIQYSIDGEEWSLLAEGVTDSCYTVSGLPKGSVCVFRVACVNGAGMGPYSHPSTATTIGAEQEDSLIPLIHSVLPGAEGGEVPAQSPFPFFPMHKSYTFLSEINRGRFGIVKQCREDVSGKMFAAKIIPYKADKRQGVLREYQVLKRLRHTHLVQLHAAFITPRFLVLVEELCAGRELLHNLAERHGALLYV
ncbi:obscurin isoform X2 [Amia ocellicauda]|uniref:obscurin isoform X2 n=1 Tax=Amia ocellicauda TaxID=2972642 RepID=UPI0034638790